MALFQLRAQEGILFLQAGEQDIPPAQIEIFGPLSSKREFLFRGARSAFLGETSFAS
jgi:hypothetical protein